MDRATAQRWLDDYVSAWKSYDRDDIAALFAEDVAYRFHPYDEPLVGREAQQRGRPPHPCGADGLEGGDFHSRRVQKL